MGKTQLVELYLKNKLINKFKYDEEKIEIMTLGGLLEMDMFTSIHHPHTHIFIAVYSARFLLATKI